VLETLPTWLRLPLLLALLAGGTYRATRIVTRDKLPLICVPREWFVQRWGAYEDDPTATWETRRGQRRVSIGGFRTNAFAASLAYLWECDWCLSIWIGSGLTYLTWRWSETMLWMLAALVTSGFTGFATKIETYLDKKTESR